jgi:hypothetical protein
MRGWHDVFHDIPMSVGTELDNIVARAEHAGLSVGRTEVTFDIDEVADLEHLRRLVEHRSDLAATRIALETLGLYTDGRNTCRAWRLLPVRGRAAWTVRRETA